jgi:hypothetical protein
MKHHGIRHPIGGHAAHVGPRHQQVHDKVLAREKADYDHPLSFHHDDDHHSCVLPEHGSHTQGQDHSHHHSGYLHKRGLTRQGETARNAKADGRKAGSGY